MKRHGDEVEQRRPEDFGPLFSDPKPLVHRDDPTASHEAAERVREQANSDRAIVAQALEGAGVQGLTAFEIDALFGWHSRSGSRAGKRLSELLREDPPRAVRLEERRGRAHVHVHPHYLMSREAA